MNNSQTNRYSSSRLKKMMTLCVGSTAIALLALLVAAVLPGSPTGGPDGPFMIAFLLLLVFLWVILPMHVIGGFATTFKYFTATDQTRFIFPLLYFVVWFVGLFLYLIFSGAAEPVFEEINVRKFRGQHAAEMELFAVLRHHQDHSSVPGLIAKVDNINLPDPQFGMTALQWAARSASANVVENLLDAGADPSIRYHQDWSNGSSTLKNASVLDIAAWSQVESKEKVLLLLDKGAKPTRQALVGACEASNLELIDRFHELEVDLQTAVEGDGLSCFHMAAKNGDVSLIQKLFAMGVVPSAQTKYTLTPLDLAMTKKQDKAAIALLKGAAPANQPKRLLELVANMPREEFELAVAHQPLTFLGSNEARIALNDAVSGCDVATIQRLLAAGLVVDKGYRDLIKIPQQCEFRELMTELIGLDGE